MIPAVGKAAFPGPEMISGVGKEAFPRLAMTSDAGKEAFPGLGMISIVGKVAFPRLEMMPVVGKMTFPGQVVIQEAFPQGNGDAFAIHRTAVPVGATLVVCPSGPRERRTKREGSVSPLLPR
ncbi:MAG TPA: hypothetical protein VN493_12970 [Thermoanaerobaculia bacterium]|nr:hypothetical protein [Thermoanaerobaculia bacterium]